MFVFFNHLTNKFRVGHKWRICQKIPHYLIHPTVNGACFFLTISMLTPRLIELRARNAQCAVERLLRDHLSAPESQHASNTKQASRGWGWGWPYDWLNPLLMSHPLKYQRGEMEAWSKQLLIGDQRLYNCCTAMILSFLFNKTGATHHIMWGSCCIKVPFPLKSK